MRGVSVVESAVASPETLLGDSAPPFDPEIAQSLTAAVFHSALVAAKRVAEGAPVTATCGTRIVALTFAPVPAFRNAVR